MSLSHGQIKYSWWGSCWLYAATQRVCNPPTSVDCQRTERPITQNNSNFRHGLSDHRPCPPRHMRGQVRVPRVLRLHRGERGRPRLRGDHRMPGWDGRVHTWVGRRVHLCAHALVYLLIHHFPYLQGFQQTYWTKDVGIRQYDIGILMQMADCAWMMKNLVEFQTGIKTTNNKICIKNCSPGPMCSPPSNCEGMGDTQYG